MNEFVIDAFFNQDIEDKNAEMKQEMRERNRIRRKCLIREKRQRKTPRSNGISPKVSKKLKSQLHKANRLNFNVEKALSGGYESLVNNNYGFYKKITGKSQADYIWATS